jgi:hypothetical protein
VNTKHAEWPIRSAALLAFFAASAQNTVAGSAPK